MNKAYFLKKIYFTISQNTTLDTSMYYPKNMKL